MDEITILIVDDEKRLRDELGEYLGKRYQEVILCGNPLEALKILDINNIDIMILDIRLPEMSGLEVLKKVKEQYPSIEVIMISGHGDMESVIEAMRCGAIDYFPKPFRVMEVENAIHRTQKFIHLKKKLQQSERTISMLTNKLYSQSGSPMIGRSKAMLDVFDLMHRVAMSDQTSVLITGESGTGKELVAHGIHDLSQRKSKTFNSVNCSAITDSLFESEFFGHKKGSFTGAVDDRTGWFEMASNGTLFLDEIGDMPLTQQAKILRVLEDKKVLPVGGKNTIEVDVRVIAASNQHLEQMTTEKTFRSDLYHRLSTFIIHLPPLRERKEDISDLVLYYANFFGHRMNKKELFMDEKTIQLLQNYQFPGNIRELRNIVERAVILCDGKELLPSHFPILQDKKSKFGTKTTITESLSHLDNAQYQAITNALSQTKNNKNKAAELLGITWQTLQRRMKKYDIEV